MSKSRKSDTTMLALLLGGTALGGWLWTRHLAHQAGVAGFGGLSDDPEFSRWFRFGAIDNGVLVVSALAGFSLDEHIAKAIGVKGYGAIIGATVGNALSDGLAALPEGRAPALGVTVGALAPLLPLAIAMGMKRKPEGATAWALGLASAGLVGWSFYQGRQRALAGV